MSFYFGDKETRLTEILVFKADPETYRQVKQIAQQQKISISQFLRSCVEEKIRK